MTEYKVTGKAQLDHLRMLILFTLFCYLVIKVAGYLWGENGIQAVLIGSGSWYLVFNLIPQSIIHFRFLYLNQGMVLLYREESGKITITRGERSVTFDLNETTHSGLYVTTQI